MGPRGGTSEAAWPARRPATHDTWRPHARPMDRAALGRRARRPACRLDSRPLRRRLQRPHCALARRRADWPLQRTAAARMAGRADQGWCQSRHDPQGADAALKRASSRRRERRDHRQPAIRSSRPADGATRCGAATLTSHSGTAPHRDAESGSPGGRPIGCRTTHAPSLPAAATRHAKDLAAGCVDRVHPRLRRPAARRAARPPVGAFRENTILVEDGTNPDGSTRPTKNRKYRTVRLLSALAQDVREYKLAIGRQSNRSLILRDDDGGPWDKNAWQMWRADRWTPACRAVGLDPIPRPYDLRHSFASLLLAEGRQPLYVARQLGHSVAVLFSTYAHLIDEYAEAPNIDVDREIANARRRGEPPYGATARLPGATRPPGRGRGPSRAPRRAADRACEAERPAAASRPGTAGRGVHDPAGVAEPLPGLLASQPVEVPGAQRLVAAVVHLRRGGECLRALALR